jgi:enamine deaminase RidA (YjgF/YER057c/UK114 family)
MIIGTAPMLGRVSPAKAAGTAAQNGARLPRARTHAFLAVLAFPGPLRNLMKTATYITHREYRPLVAVARDDLCPAPPYPANALVVVQGLAEPHFPVEIEAIAVLD